MAKAGAGLYRRFLQLCEEWPVDSTKAGRDLGTYIREKVAKGFRQGEASVVNQEECEQNYDSLSKINSSYYRTLYPRVKTHNVTGTTLEECRLVVSSDSLKILKGEQ